MNDTGQHSPQLDHERLDTLLSMLCDERLSEAEFAELDAVLGVSPEARTIYRRYLNVHSTLHTYLEADAVREGELLVSRLEEARDAERELAAVPAEPAAEENVMPMPAASTARVPNIPPARTRPIPVQPRQRVNPFGLAAAAIVVFGLGLFGVQWVYENYPEVSGRGVPLATLSESVEVRWAPGSHVPKQGESIGNKTLKLESGSIRLNFARGASLSLTGKGEIEILSDNSARLMEGKLLAEVPKPATGFTVESDVFDVIDIGTVFGMRTLETGEIEVAVLSGDVELAVLDETSGEKVRIQQLRKWQAIRANPADRTVEKVRFDLIPYRGMRAPVEEEAE